MAGRSWGAALTTGLAAGAIGLACLLGAVLRASALPPEQSVSLREAHPGQHPRSVPARSRDGASDDKGLQEAPKERRPPVRLWRGPTPEKHPPRPRKALA